MAATQTQFNGQNLLDGTFAGAQFQVGANSNQIINVAVGNTQTNGMGNYTTTTTGGVYTSSGSFQQGGYAAGGAFTISAGGTGNFTSGAIAISGSVGSANVNISASTESAANIASAVNAVSSQTGVSAQAYTSVAFTVSSGTYTFTLSNGSSGSPTNAVNISADVVNGSNGQPDLSSLVTAINNQAAITGTSASTQTVSGQTELVLTNANGNNINISAGLTSTGALIGSGLSSGSTGSFTAVSGSALSPIGSAITSGSANALIQGAVQFESASSYAIGSGSAIGFSSAAASLTSGAGGSQVASINVSTAAGAQQAISILDQAINYLNQQNGALGAIQNRIQASVSNDQTTATNDAAPIQSTDKNSSAAQEIKVPSIAQPGSKTSAADPQLDPSKVQQSIDTLKAKVESTQSTFTLEVGLDPNGQHPNQVLLQLRDKATKQVFYSYYVPADQVAKAAESENPVGLILQNKA